MKWAMVLPTGGERARDATRYQNGYLQMSESPQRKRTFDPLPLRKALALAMGILEFLSGILWVQT